MREKLIEFFFCETAMILTPMFTALIAEIT